MLTHLLKGPGEIWRTELDKVSEIQNVFSVIQLYLKANQGTNSLVHSLNANAHCKQVLKNI